MDKELPTKWISVPLEEIIDFVVGGDWGKDPDLNLGEDYVKAACIRGSEIKNWKRDKGLSAAERQIKISSLETRKLKLGDILLEISGGGPDQPVGRTILIDEDVFLNQPELPKVCSNFMRLIRLSDQVNKPFINYYLQFFYNTGEVVNYQGGSNNLRNLKYKEYSQISIQLPPLAEQKRIVAKLDKAFQHLDTLKAKLDRIPDLLKNFRQAVLTQAVTGKLTEEWRKESNSQQKASDLIFEIKEYKKKWAIKESEKGNSEAKRLLSKINSTEEYDKGDLPNSWQVQSLNDICHLVVDCHNKTAPYEESGIYLVRTSNIKNGRIILNDIRYVSEDTYNFWSRRCPPKPGDILFTREAPMGEAAIIPEDMQVCLGQRTMLLRMPEGLLLNKYVLYCLLAPEMMIQINERAVGSGVKHLRVGDVESITIPVPPFEEQKEIVKKVEALFAKADAIEAQYLNLKEKIDKLPQALLAKAFRGELVPQYSNDEPASVLLEKIKAGKNGEAKVGKGKKAKTGKSQELELFPIKW
jgi:type I restriction enzyme S subunit